MKKAFLVFLLIAAYSLQFVAYAQDAPKAKKVVMIIAQDGFRDDELFPSKEALERNGIQVKIASTVVSEARGSLGAKVKPDMLLSDVNPRDFDAVVFIGGMGATQYLNDPIAHKIAQDTVSSNRIIAAICIAPAILARAGILKGKRATVVSGESAQLKDAGAIYTGRPVEKDGNIITADGPSSAKQFGEELAMALQG